MDGNFSCEKCKRTLFKNKFGMCMVCGNVNAKKVEKKPAVKEEKRLSRSGPYPGEIYVDGKEKYSGMLGAYPSNNLSYLSIRKNSWQEEEIVISPFSKIKFSPCYSVKHVWWRCEGSSIGSYSIGPKGHPADSEYDIWKLKNFRIDGAFSKDGLEIKVVADTDRGDEQEWDHTNYGIYPELNVKFKFFVEKEALQVFLGIQNEHLPEYMEALEKLE